MIELTKESGDTSMRVNIMGKGVCPVLGTLLPILNADVSEGTLVELINVRNIRVFDCITGVQVTSRNYKNFLMRRFVSEKAQAPAPIEPVKVSEKVEKKKKLSKKAVEEAPATVEAVPETPVEETPAETVETPVEETNTEVETVLDETETSVDTPIEEVDEISESSTEPVQTESTYSNNNKKKKRR